MTAQSGLPSSKVKTYVEVLEKYDIFNKHALYLLKQEEVDSIAKECGMGPPTKAQFVKLWMSGQSRQDIELASRPPGSREVIEALPPGAQDIKLAKAEEAKKVRAYTRLNLTKDEVTGDEES